MSAHDQPPPGDQARVSVLVAVEPDAAFRIFTEEIDQWWRRGLKYRLAGTNRGIIRIEPGIGGRLIESFETGSVTTVVETGRVTVWEPPSRLVFDWRAANFAPAEKTEVEVVFEPSPSGTLVTVTHRGWSAIRPDHPARHGLEVAAFLRLMGLWWSDLMSSLRGHAVAAGRR
ncbi:MAG TPA: SRPBCC domain-containing protein [Dehalococcoidia bacterium]|nr:SRPBCC domain-containing protein [Dehalococcoidia bacterium]